MAATDFHYQAFEQPDQESGGAPKLSIRDRLVPPMLGNPLWGWLGPLIVAVFGAYLRFSRLSLPNVFAFDETYYAKDAFATLRYGAERQFVDGANDLLLAADMDVFKKCELADQCATWAVHPPLGKWMIALGELLFGVNSYGWRFSAALIGSLSILILARVARRMTRSTLLGCLAGLLLSLDGLHFVLSRTALLDIFLMFWILAGFGCLVVDRDRVRGRMGEWREAHSEMSGVHEFSAGPRLGLRPWRLAAGLCLGAALSVKWTGLFFIIAFTIMSLVWDAGARRAIGLAKPYSGTVRRDLPLAALWMGLAPLLTYVTSFAGWFATNNGYARNWAQATSPGNPVFFVIDSLRSWVSLQESVLTFHTGLDSHHPYQSEPWSWPLLIRPVAFYASYDTPPSGCGAKQCAAEMIAVGTPTIWFGGFAALIAMIAWYTATRDWRAGTVLVGYAAGWLPWFYFAIADHRTMFFFYTIPMVPFMILAIVLACGLIIGSADATSRRRLVGGAVVGAFVLLTLVNFWWIHPILTGDVLPRSDWVQRMLFKSWI